MGIKAIRGGLIWIVEFDPQVPPLVKVSESIFRLAPPILGIG